ncbi:MAG: AI-2E family transporter [Marmoricola sp.]
MSEPRRIFGRPRRDQPKTEAAEPLGERLAQQWADMRAGQRREPVIEAGPSNFTRAQVPWAFDLAAAWAWRMIIIAVAIYGILWLLSYFAVIVLPLLIALLLAAMSAPVLQRLMKLGLPRGFAAFIIVLLGLGLVGGLLYFVGQQVGSGIGDLSKQVAAGIETVRTWLATGPLQISDNDLSKALEKIQEQLTGISSGSVLGHVTALGTTVGHVFAAFFIVLFASYFFLADGPLIWSWFVRLFPRAARLRADSSGKVAWTSLTQFVRATLVVAATDAMGIALGAAILGVPFTAAIGVLVFLGAFVPMIGATISGTVAVLVALVAHGFWTALWMLLVVIAVQQFEAHVLQPFLMGRFVSVHPLGVIVAIGCGVIVAGVAGALIAVPVAAAVNAVVEHLAAYSDLEPEPDDSPPPDRDALSLDVEEDPSE